MATWSGIVEQVQRDALLAPVPYAIARFVAHTVAAGRLYADNSGAIIAQEHGGQRTGHALGNVQDRYPVQRAGHIPSLAARYDEVVSKAARAFPNVPHPGVFFPL